MQINHDPNGARRSILASVDAAPREHKVQVFLQYCGPVTFSYGTYRARCCRITATSTADATSAVIAWTEKAKEAEGK
jgi:hypothetical protein